MSLRYGSEAQHSFGTVSAPTTINALTGVTGKRLFVYRLLITVGAVTTPPATFLLQDTQTNAMSQTFQLGQTGGIALDVPFNDDPWWFTGQGLAGAPQIGQGYGINFIVTGVTGSLGYDIWWDAHP